MRLFFFYFVAACLLISCNQSGKIQQLQKQTEDVHDEAMANMAVMNRATRNFKKEIAKLDSLSTPVALARKDSLIQIIGQMDKAEEEMMAWMTEYHAPDGMPNAQALEYLKSEYDKILKNRNAINTAINAGKLLAH
jgi:hypothetical protein